MSSSLRLKLKIHQQYKMVKLSVKKQTRTDKKAMKKGNTDKKVINSKQSTFLYKKDKGKQEVDLKCDMCDNTCKKRNILNKHTNTKQSDHICKISYKIFSNSMDALA